MVSSSRFPTCSSALELERMELADGTLEKMQAAVRTLIEGVGEDPSREGLVETPRRVAKAWLDLTAGGGRDAAQRAFGQALFHEPLLTASPDGIVLVRDITFASLSQDTLLPFHGRAHVAYVPQAGVVLGLSKLARVTRALSGKVQRLEQLAADLMAAVQQEIAPKGVFVAAQATVLGAGPEPAAKETSAACGCFADKGSGLCEEVRMMLGRRRRGGEREAAAAAGGDGEAVPAGAPPAAMVAAVEALLRGVGEDPGKESLKGSAERYVRWLQGATAGYGMALPGPDPLAAAAAAAAQRGRPPPTPSSPMPAQKTAPRRQRRRRQRRRRRPAPTRRVPPAPAVTVLRFTSQCEHHLLPFYGTVKVAHSAAAGHAPAAVAAALARCVEAFSRRLQVQERLTQQVADAAAAVVGPGHDVLVLVESAHMCMVARGVEEHASATATTAARGGLGGGRRRARARPGCPAGPRMTWAAGFFAHLVQRLLNVLSTRCRRRPAPRLSLFQTPRQRPAAAAPQRAGRPWKCRWTPETPAPR